MEFRSPHPSDGITAWSTMLLLALSEFAAPTRSGKPSALKQRHASALCCRRLSGDFHDCSKVSATAAGYASRSSSSLSHS